VISRRSFLELVGGLLAFVLGGLSWTYLAKPVQPAGQFPFPISIPIQVRTWMLEYPPDSRREPMMMPIESLFSIRPETLERLQFVIDSEDTIRPVDVCRARVKGFGLYGNPHGEEIWVELTPSQAAECRAGRLPFSGGKPSRQPGAKMVRVWVLDGEAWRPQLTKNSYVYSADARNYSADIPLKADPIGDREVIVTVGSAMCLSPTPENPNNVVKVLLEMTPEQIAAHKAGRYPFP
jgi:hypothetical protein